MKLKIIVAAVLTLVVAVLSSCMSSGIMINIDVSCDEFELKSANLENEFEIKKGDKIKAKICANPTTGFSWDYSIDNENVMKLESHEFVEPETDLVGAGGTDVWIFKTVGTGNAVIKMEYSQAGSSAVERTYTLDVLVMDK